MPGLPENQHMRPGPVLYTQELSEHFDKTNALLQVLVSQIRAPKRAEIYSAAVGGQTDGNGDLLVKLYDVPGGFRFSLTRLILEAYGYTPAVPYSNAAAWLGIYAGNPETAAAGTVIGGLRDFGPASAGGPIFPCLFTDWLDAAKAYRSGVSIWLRVESGPASTQVAGELQGVLSEIE